MDMEDLEEKIDYYEERVNHFRTALDNVEDDLQARWEENSDVISFDSFEEYLEHGIEVLEVSLSENEEVLERLKDDYEDLYS